jgi:hypothetical protein
MNKTDTCGVCFARDRDRLIAPAVKRRTDALVQKAVQRMRALPGAGLSGEDCGLKDVFEEWADQLAYEESWCFEDYGTLALTVCEQVVAKLSELERDTLAAFSDAFIEYSCTSEFTDDNSMEGFDASFAAAEHLYRAFVEFAINYGEENAERLGRHQDSD